MQLWRTTFQENTLALLPLLPLPHRSTFVVRQSKHGKERRMTFLLLDPCYGSCPSACDSLLWISSNVWRLQLISCVHFSTSLPHLAEFDRCSNALFNMCMRCFLAIYTHATLARPQYMELSLPFLPCATPSQSQRRLLLQYCVAVGSRFSAPVSLSVATLSFY